MRTQTVVIPAVALILGLVIGAVGGYKRGANQHSVQVAGAPRVQHDQRHDSFDEVLQDTVIPFVDFQDSDLNDVISLLQCRTFEMNHELGGIQIAVGHPLMHDPQRNDMTFTLQARDLSVREILDRITEEAGIVYSIRPCVVLWGKQEPTKPNKE